MSDRLFDSIRKLWVVATPEEVVRQSLLRMLVEELGFPKELIAIEKELSELPHLNGSSFVPQRRLDILCFTPMRDELAPLLLIECKERGLSAAAKEQVIGYNHFVKAPFIAIAAEEGIEVGYYDNDSSCYDFNCGLMYYSEFVENI